VKAHSNLKIDLVDIVSGTYVLQLVDRDGKLVGQNIFVVQYLQQTKNATSPTTYL